MTSPLRMTCLQALTLWMHAQPEQAVLPAVAALMSVRLACTVHEAERQGSASRLARGRWLSWTMAPQVTALQNHWWPLLRVHMACFEII